MAAQDASRILRKRQQSLTESIAPNNERPVDQRMIEKAFNRLKLNHSDLKATQGDTGHAEVDMITRVYAHSLDEDRKINTQKFEFSFYPCR